MAGKSPSQSGDRSDGPHSKCQARLHVPSLDDSNGGGASFIIQNESSSHLSR